mmetsp:Transcript_9804/g.20350  ORF Transcript_9804/g.20350 Transcript_9804/m.20350 type:complete len:406 (-) Transcript_9804:36-1253(-)
MFISIGLLFLTAVYLGMVAALEHYFRSECLGNGDCIPEGVDNTILTWSSDLFVALCAFIFALHLSCYASEGRDVRKSGILSQIFMGGAFVSAGVGRLLYPNSGAEDNHGMVGYWFVKIIAIVFFAASALALARFAISTSDKKKDTMVIVFVSVVLLAAGLFMAGGVWCTLVPDLQVLGVVDEFEPTTEIHLCLRMMGASTVLMNFAYAFLWLPVGVLLKAASRKKPIRFLGLPTPAAAIIAVVMQWTVGSMFVGILFLICLYPKIDYFEVSTRIYGTVLYHWGMMMSLYCLHNLSYGLPWEYYDSSVEENYDENKYRSGKVYPIDPRPAMSTRSKRSRHSNRKQKDDPPSLSWEWWVAGVASLFPEPKTTTRTIPSMIDDKSVVSDGFMNSLKQVKFHEVEEAQV